MVWIAVHVLPAQDAEQPQRRVQRRDVALEIPEDQVVEDLAREALPEPLGDEGGRQPGGRIGALQIPDRARQTLNERDRHPDRSDDGVLVLRLERGRHRGRGFHELDEVSWQRAEGPLNPGEIEVGFRRPAHLADERCELLGRLEGVGQRLDRLGEAVHEGRQGCVAHQDGLR